MSGSRSFFINDDATKARTTSTSYARLAEPPSREPVSRRKRTSGGLKKLRMKGGVSGDEWRAIARDATSESADGGGANEPQARLGPDG
jgi:hypothetical protein